MRLESLQTDPDGNFAFNRLSGACYEMRVEASLYRTHKLTIDKPAKALVIELQPRDTAKRDRYEVLKKELAGVVKKMKPDEPEDSPLRTRRREIEIEMNHIEMGPPPPLAPPGEGACGGGGSCG